MAIIDATTFAALTSTAPSGDDLVACSAIAEAVSEAITRLAYPILLEPVTFTLAAFDAPLGNVLLLPRPVRSITELYVKWYANGDSSQLTSADLLTPFQDYMLEVDDKVNQWGRAGKVYRRGTSSWGHEYRRSIGNLASAIEPNRQAVFVSYEGGPATVSAAVQLAASSAVSLLMQRRKTGAPLNSESWGGYSYSTAGQFTADAAINSPEVMGLLRAAGCLPLHVGG